MINANKVMTENEHRKFLKALKSNSKNSNDPRMTRDYFFFTFIANTGLRVSEALNLTHEDVFHDYLIIKPEFSKNKKAGTVYFGKNTKALIEEIDHFKNERSIDNTLLLSFNPKPSSRSYMHSRFKYWLKLCDLPKHHSIHTLRHTYATISLNKGLSLTFVRDNLRHSNISITSQYLHVTRENRERVKHIF